MAYFVPNFSLIIFMKTKKIYLVPPTHNLARTAKLQVKIENSFWRSTAKRVSLFSSRLAQNDRKNRIYLISFQPFLKILKGFSAHANDLACFGSRCVGVCRNLMSPTFLGVFLDVESDKKNRFKFWPLFHPPGPKQFFFYFAHIF